MANRYRLVGDHAEDLADGRIVAPGEVTQLTAEQLKDPHNKRLVDEELLLPVPAKKDGDR